MGIITDFGAFIAKIFSFLQKIKPAVHAILVNTDAILTQFKNWEDTTPLGEFFQTAIEPLIPGLGFALQNYYAVAFKALKWAEAETDKPDDQIVADGLNYLKNIEDPAIKASQWNTFAALTSHFATSNNGLGMTIQQHLMLPQPIHNDAILELPDVAA